MAAVVPAPEEVGFLMAIWSSFFHNDGYRRGWPGHIFSEESLMMLGLPCPIYINIPCFDHGRDDLAIFNHNQQWITQQTGRSESPESS